MRRFLLIPLLFLAAKSFAQYTESTVIKAYKSNGADEQYLAWCGGFNNPEINLADLNHDGLQDLVVYEWSQALVKTFLNTGSNTDPHYAYAPHYAQNFPVCYDYLQLRDYNADGIPDLFEKGLLGFIAYKGYYNSANELCFTHYKDLGYTTNNGFVNAYTQAGDIPGIADVDGDGDLDFFGYDVNGSILSFYKNCRVEHGLPPDSIEVCYAESCWGRMNQGFIRAYSLAVNNCPTSGTFGCKTTLHPGNALCFMDYDGDGDMDLMDGNLTFSDMQLLLNGKAQLGGRDSIISQDTLWQSGGHQLYLPNWPVPHWMDIDGDGDKDLLFSPHAQNNAENIKTIQLYRNNGSDAAPNFQYETDSFITEHTIDAGNASAPLFYDYDKDGRPDLFIGSEGVYQTNGLKTGKVLYYHNTSVAGQPSFTLAATDFLNISALNIAGARPAIGDLDNDGKDDLALGHTDGTITFYTNAAASNAVQPAWVLSQLKLHNTFGDSIDAGVAASPFIYDINKDGHPDLLIGNQGGTVHYYENLGSGLQLQFQTNSLGNLRANPNNIFSGFATLYIGRVDTGATEYILMGNDSGHIRRYTGFQSGIVTGSYTLLEDQYSGIHAGLRSHPAVADVDGDGHMDMLVGNALGGLFQFQETDGLSAGSLPSDPTLAGCIVSPNPAKENAAIAWTDDFARSGAVRIQLLTATGQVVYVSTAEAATHLASIEVKPLPAGIYFLRITNERGKEYRSRLTVVH